MFTMHKYVIFLTTVCICLLIIFGLDFLLLVISCLLAVIIGVLIYFFCFGTQKRTVLLKEFKKLSNQHRFMSGLSFILNDRLRFQNFSIYAEKHSMTGSDKIDLIIEQILQYILRDFVDSWFKNITPNSLFQESIKRTFRRTVSAFSHCVNKVDWSLLLIQNFVDDFASHLRLYRKAKEKIEIQKESLLKTEDLESVFFDLELDIEKNYCRDLVSTSSFYESGNKFLNLSTYLHDITDILLYLLMPSEDFRSRPLRFLIREVIVFKIIIPILDKISDPLYVNYLIVWLLSEISIGTDNFVECLETCQNVQELESILESIHEEINLLRSKNNLNNSESFKQQLTSLEFTENLIKRRMILLADEPEATAKNQFIYDQNIENDSKFVHLPIKVVLTHRPAVSFFINFLNQVGGQHYIDFYFSIEGFKTSVKHQLRGLAETNDLEVHETVKEAALFMYRQYLSQEAITRVPIDDSIINKFLARLRNDEPIDSWFKNLQDKVVEILATDDRFYPSFKRHPLYLRILDELRISSIDDEEIESNDESIELENIDTRHDLSHNTNNENNFKTMVPKSSNLESQKYENLKHSSDILKKEIVANTSKSITYVIVDMLGIGHQSKQMFALYNVRVTKTDEMGHTLSTWNVIRRYSDFHKLYALVLRKFPNLQNVSFPGKKTFNNLDQAFLEQRCKALNYFMKCILQPTVLEKNPGIEAEIFNFLSQKHYGKNVTNMEEKITKKVVFAMFDPILSGVRSFGTAVTAVPDQVFDGIGKVSLELNKAATQVLKGNTENLNFGVQTYKNLLDSSRAAAHLTENGSNNENIPLRVLLLFVDEVFGLRRRNQWFRRRLVALLRQFINATFGSSINRRILDAVQWLVSSEQVANYLTAFRNFMWSETKVTELHPTSEALRTRFLARCLMLSALPDELRLFIGASTTINGINNISEALQNRHLNRRFWYVILERLLLTIFPHNHFEKVLPMLHSKSPRTHFV